MESKRSFIMAVIFCGLTALQPHDIQAGHCRHCQHECGSATACHHCQITVERKPVKKVVYQVKCVPVCEHGAGKLLHGDCCPVCQLFYKKILVKREIEVGEKCIKVCEPVENCPSSVPSEPK